MMLVYSTVVADLKKIPYQSIKRPGVLHFVTGGGVFRT